MNYRALFLFVLVLVSTLSFAGAQTSAPVPSGIDIPAFSALAGCDMQAMSPTDQPAPMFMTGACGDCSSVPCRGSSPGAACGIVGGKVYTCQDTDLVCSTPLGSVKCACRATPL